MVKIQKVKINGIRGFKSIDVDGVISPRIIDINGKNCFVLGENGSGKSSLYDALEWCITGECKEASYRRCDPCNEFLKNKTCDFSPKLFVELDLDNDHKLIRKLIKSSAFCSEIVEPAENGIKHDFLDASFIDVNRINKFVLEAPSNLWKAFSDLLNFDDVRAFDKKILKLNSEIAKKFEDIKTKYESMKIDKEKLEIEIRVLRESLVKELGVDWENKKESLLEKENNANQFKKLNELLILFFKTSDNFKEYSSIKSKKEYEKNNTTILIDDLKLKVINSAEEYFSKTEKLTECPICHNTNINSKRITEELSQLKQRNENYSIIVKDLAENDVLLQKSILEMAKLLKELRSLLLNLGLKKYILEEDNSQIEVLNNKKEELSVLIKENSLSNIHIIKQFDEKYGDFTKINNQLGIYTKDYAKLKIANDEIFTYQKIYSEKYKNRIKEDLVNLSSDKVFIIYNAINQSKNDELITDLQIEVSKLEEIDPQIAFKVKIGDKYEDAVSYLSTGHLKCLGFALLVAKFELKKPKINTLIIDDPTYAIDHEHRYNLIQYFHKLSNEKIQLIIFSSDRLFFEILGNTFKTDSFISYETENTFEQGVNYKDCKANFLDKAKQHLGYKDIRATSLYSRLALEDVLVKTAYKLNLKTKFGQKTGMSQLINDYHIEQELKNKYVKNLEELNIVFTNLKQPKCTKILLGNSFALDHELHHVHENRDSYTLAEVSEAVNHIEKFINTINRIINA